MREVEQRRSREEWDKIEVKFVWLDREDYPLLLGSFILSPFYLLFKEGIDDMVSWEQDRLILAFRCILLRLGLIYL